MTIGAGVILGRSFISSRLCLACFACKPGLAGLNAINVVDSILGIHTIQSSPIEFQAIFFASKAAAITLRMLTSSSVEKLGDIAFRNG